jgi:hypothetical protein
MPVKFHSGEGSSKTELMKNLKLADLRSIFFIGIIGLTFSLNALLSYDINPDRR